jgi:succinoglycan biosynthesis transport protein ExoP
MESGLRPGDGTALRDYVNVVLRRRWIILLALVLVPAAGVAYSLEQEQLYRATAEVLIGRQNLAASLTGTIDPSVYQQADRIIQTQANLARVPEVAGRVLERAGLTGTETPKQFLARSAVTAKQNSDMLEFAVTDENPSFAARLATLYANEFKTYRREIDTASLERARSEVQERMTELERDGKTSSPLYPSLVDKEQQLSTMEALQTSNAFVVKSADDAEQVQPRPLRNGVLGFALGLVLGLGLAFLWEALDTRIRSADELEQQLGLPLLARIPEPPRRLRKENRLAMLANPRGTHAETLRILKMNLEFMKLGRAVKTIMVTSAVEQEGKSTTVANLAIALARAGESVCLVDLDLRRPFLDKFFDLGDRPGLTQVALGQVELEEALTPIVVPGASSNGNGNGNGKGKHGLLYVLPAGAIPPNPGELVVSEQVANMIAGLRERFTTVLIDAPPVLQVGDAMALSSGVDGLFVVTRLNVVRRPMVKEFRRALDASPALKLGFAVTGAESEGGYGYGGYRYGSYAAPKERVSAG